jgi:Family of unknown function (DUF6346)
MRRRRRRRRRQHDPAYARANGRPQHPQRSLAGRRDQPVRIRRVGPLGGHRGRDVQDVVTALHRLGPAIVAEQISDVASRTRRDPQRIANRRADLVAALEQRGDAPAGDETGTTGPQNSLRHAPIDVRRALLGGAVTLTRMAGRDFAGAERHGQRCTATITWDDGQVTRTVADAVFTSADTGTTVQVGDLGTYRSSKQLVRSDTDRRPWLAWIGYGTGAAALIPGLVAVLLVRELLRFRRR